MVLLIGVVFVLVLILIPVLYWYYILFKNRSLNKIPGPEPIMFLGSVVPKDPYELMEVLLKLHVDYGPTVKLHIGPYVNVIFSKPDDIQTILNSPVHLDKTFGYDLLKPWMGEGLIVAKGDKWKGRRKMLNPSFHFKILEEFMHTFNSASDILVHQLAKEEGKDSVELLKIIQLFGLDVICETSMGVKINAQTDPSNTYPGTIEKVLNIVMWRFFCAWASIDFLFWLLVPDKYKILTESIKTLHKFSKGVIERRRKEYKDINKRTKQEIDEFYAKPKRALLDFLLTCEEAHSLSDEDIREEIDTFMFAGQDTVTSSLSLILLQLSRNLEIQNKLYEEIQSMTEDTDGEIKMQTLNEMKYLDMVIKEGMRIRTPAPLIQRKIATDCYLNGIMFPKGTIITMHIIQLHQDPEIYPDPEKFIPERFTSENQVNRHNFAYIPFSAGYRNCIGQKFAMLEMKVALIKIFRKFEILPVPGFKERLGATGVLKSQNGACVRLKCRI